jgi:hypothetical protein
MQRLGPTIPWFLHTVDGTSLARGGISREDTILLGGGVGALVGMGIDALIQGRKDIYVRAQASRSIEVTPLMLSQAKGVSVSLQF